MIISHFINTDIGVEDDVNQDDESDKNNYNEDKKNKKK